MMDTETTCLRIKFIQSLKNVASKCCVEIVPEISCIDNLDKIELNKETDVIEYTFPMIYKITLKPSPKSEENINDEKTYHSCVDLTCNPSMAENCRNIIRILSDNKLNLYNFNKDIVHVNKTELAVREKKVTSAAVGGDLTVYIGKETNTASKYNHDDASKTRHAVVKSVFSKFYNLMDKDHKTAENSCTDIESREFEMADIDDMGSKKQLASRTICLISDPKQNDTKNRLSVNPIYSISAGESEKHISVAHKLSGDSDTHIVPVHSIPATCEISITNNKIIDSQQFNKEGNLYPFSAVNRNSVLSKSFQDSNYERSRMPLDIKLAYFRRLMEKEVRPLKIILNNIIQKCVLLGVHDELRKTAQNPIAYETNRDVDTKCVVDSPGELNRGVYYVVFDD